MNHIGFSNFQSISPIDVAIFPLFEKDGMDTIAHELHQRCCATSGLVSLYDASGSIGKRYARADEIGIPICVTIDHQSIDDQTVTLRNRDDGTQTRVSLALIEETSSRTVTSL